MSNKKKEIHTTIDRRIYTDVLLPFSSQKDIDFNIVLETLLETVYLLCKQNNMNISFDSLLEVKKRVLNGNYKFVNPIVVLTDNNGGTTISIPKERKKIVDKLIKSMSGEVFIKKIDKNESGKNIETDSEYLKAHGGEAPRSDVKKHLIKKME